LSDAWGDLKIYSSEIKLL